MRKQATFSRIVSGLTLLLFMSCSKSSVTPASAQSSAVTPAVTLPGGYSLVWQDNFDGTALDSTKWWISTKLRDLAQQTTAAVSVSSGNLHIRTYTEGGTNYTGFITTANRYNATYGYFEARIRYHGAPGEHAAFWLQSPTVGNPLGNPLVAGTEIDISEHRLVDHNGVNIENKSNCALHWDGYSTNHKSVAYLATSPTTLNNTWHTYAVLWTPDQYIFYIDGIEQWRTSEAISGAPEEIRLTCEVTLNSWAGPNPAGGYGPPNSSNYGMDVDWVRVWQKK